MISSSCANTYAKWASSIKASNTSARAAGASRSTTIPAQGIHRQKGVILGAYTFDPRAGEKFARLSPPERIELAIRQGEKIHPRHRNYVEKGVSVAWHQMNHMLGCAAQWDEELFKKWFKRLQEPAGHHYLIGDQVSYHPSWQEGAIASAHHAIADIDRRVRENRVVAA